MTALDDRPDVIAVADGYVVTGRFAGASASRDERWTCYGRRCFATADGWWVHEPECQSDHESPVWPDRRLRGYEQRAISAAEDGDLWVERAVPRDLVWRERYEAQARVRAAVES